MIPLNDALAYWEARTGHNRSELDKDYLQHQQARRELEDVSGEHIWHGWSSDKAVMLEFWKNQFKLFRGLNPEATAICIKQINRLRGR